MVTLGIDAHKCTHTIVAIDDLGRQLAVKTVATTTKDHLGLLVWAEQLADSEGLLWAIEDCRHLSRRLERDLLAAGQSIVRVPTKLMAHVRASSRTYGKSDPIDALAVARAAQREHQLPVARLDGPDREVRLYSPTIANPLSQNGLDASAGYAGTSTNSTRHGNPRPARWTASAPWTMSHNASRTSKEPSHDLREDSSNAAANSARRSLP
jgi:hypothetical protein